MTCPPEADHHFGPRVDPHCRPFDFTLLFQDAFFLALPAAAFLLLLPLRLRRLHRAPVKVTSYRLASWKLSLLALLITSHLLHLIFLLPVPALKTSLSLPASIIALSATVAAALPSFLEDQRSLPPSDLLVLYFSAATLLALPRLRTLFTADVAGGGPAPTAAWTAVFVCTLALAVVESLGKARFLRPVYRTAATAEETTGFWGRGLFTWVLPFLGQGYRRVLAIGDVPRVDSELEEERAWGALEAAWRRRSEGGGGRYRLMRAVWEANVGGFGGAVLPRIALGAFGFCQPFLIEAAVKYMGRKGEDGEVGEAGDERHGQALVGGVVLVYVGIAISRAVYWRQTFRMLTRIRAGLIASIFRHTVALQETAVKDSAAITLMGTDVERIVQSLRLVHELWASIPEVAIGIWLLARQLGVASVVPLIICLASLLGSGPIAARFGPAQRVWVERVERRIAVTASMLSDMKAVKMLGLSGVLESIISQLRVVELKASETFRSLIIWQILVGNAPQTLAPFVTFTVYAIIAVVKKDEGLLGAQAFASLSLISLVTMPLILFSSALSTFTQGVACFERVEKYLLKQPASASSGPPSLPVLPSADGALLLGQLKPSQKTGSKHSIVSFQDAVISWSTDAPEPVLRDLTLTIPSGLTAIVGPVASGKSTLLASILGETKTIRGSMATNTPSGTAFSGQTPWIMNDTIRHNITGGVDFDQKWYDFSVLSSGLQDDLDGMPAGDFTKAGSNGTSLSGGQRQRVALARAVYSRLPVVVLDDVLSGLDSKTARFIIDRLFARDAYFRKAGISVVLATHNRNVLPYMDAIVVLDSGKVADFGPYEDVRLRSASLIEQSAATLTVSDSVSDGSDDADDRTTSKTPKVADVEDAEMDAQKANLARQDGSWSVYKYYSKSAGASTMIMWALFTLCGAVTANVIPIWVERWTSANEREPNQRLGFYLGVYAVFVVLAPASTLGECWVFIIKVINNTALKLHSDLLDSTLRAPFAFFQKTDAGTITNRFSQDMDLIDLNLPMQAIQFTTGAASCAVQLIIICVLGKYLAAAMPFLAATLFVVQRYYLRTSRQVRLLDIEAKAPLYKLFIETATGVATIRAYRWTSTLHERHAAMLNLSQRPFYMLLCIQQWLSLVLDLIVGALAVVLVCVAISTTDGLSAGTLGVSLVLVLEFSSLLTQTIQAWTKLETSIGAVARVQDFIDTTPREPDGVAIVDSTWPARGEIQFHNVAAGPDKPPILTNLTLSIASGEKLAICGPSGSGKTSLLMSLLRMIDLHQGHVTIDGTDISTLNPDDLRARLNVVPQDPYFVPGTVRFNLDLRGRASDAELEAAVTKVGLWARVQGAGGLDAELVGSEWSQGERQLLCLARAVVGRSRVLVLDEAMSSVDAETEAVMQAVVEEEFGEATVVAVMHRFTYIERYDRVAVLRERRLVECDAPVKLLGTEGSVFGGLYAAHRGVR